MKQNFSGYYGYTEEEFIKAWDCATFIFDTNVLLNLYRYPKQAQDELSRLISSVADRVWIPSHVYLEFQRRRPKVILDQNKRFSDVISLLSKFVPNLERDLEKMQLRERHSSINVDPILARIKDIVDRYIVDLKAVEDQQVGPFENDPIRDNLDSLFGENIGPFPTAEWLEKLKKEGEQRYKHCIPPGYMDQSKTKDDNDSFYSYKGARYEARFGDLIVWKQIIEHCKSKSIKQVIFITDDQKEDWWWSIESNGKKTLGPRPELTEEIVRESSVEFFHMYNSVNLLKFAQKLNKSVVSRQTIEHISDVNQLESTSIYNDNEFINRCIKSVSIWAQKKYPNYKLEISGSYPDVILRNIYNGHFVFIEVGFYNPFTPLALIRGTIDQQLDKINRLNTLSKIEKILFPVIKMSLDARWDDATARIYGAAKSNSDQFEIILGRVVQSKAIVQAFDFIEDRII